MSAMLLVARLVLAGVFLLAGCAKLRDLPGSRSAVRDFGVPSRLAPSAALVLPLLELALGVCLLLPATARWAAIGSALLLVMFTVVIVVSLLRGVAPDCHCFGQLHSSVVGWRTLARNAVLLAVATFVVTEGPGVSATAWVGKLTAAAAVSLIGSSLVAALLAFLSWFSFQLLRQQGRLLTRIEVLEGRPGVVGKAPRASGHVAGLAVRSAAPDFSLLDFDGKARSLESFVGSGLPTMLVFPIPDAAPAPRCFQTSSIGSTSTRAHYLSCF